MKKIGKHFGRSFGYRKALFSNLSKELIRYELIKTTLSKAKELRRFFEPLITCAKKNTLSSRRSVLKKIKDKVIVTKLFSILGKRYLKRPGGYVRILKYRYRHGDAATLAIVKLVK